MKYAEFQQRCETCQLRNETFFLLGRVLSKPKAERNISVGGEGSSPDGGLWLRPDWAGPFSSSAESGCLEECDQNGGQTSKLIFHQPT